jgi:hypothetical protein
MTPLLISIGLWAHLLFFVGLLPGGTIGGARFTIMGTLLLGMIYFWVNFFAWVIE